MKRRHLKRPPGHPLINVSECCMGSPGSQQQNWVYQLFAKLLFSCCGSLTGDSPQMNNTSPRFNSESIRNEALFAQCFLTCAAECEAVNGLWRAGVTAKSYKIFIVWGVANWLIYWRKLTQSGCSLKIREAIVWLDDCGLASKKGRGNVLVFDWIIIYFTLTS